MGIGVSLKISRSRQAGFLALTKEYFERVTLDSGTVRYLSDVNTFYKFLNDEGLTDATLLLWFGDAGIKTRGTTVSATPVTFVSKGYSLDATPNDLTQTTELNQPFLSGNIAPNERYGIKGLGDVSLKRVIHPTIAYMTDDAWTISLCFNNYGTSDSTLRALFSRGIHLTSQLLIGSGGLVFYSNNTSNQNIIPTNELNALNSRNIILTLIGNNSTLNAYFNGVNIGTYAIDTSLNIRQILSSSTTGMWNGCLNYYRIQDGAMTAQQVADEHTLLRSMYPEIESVEIGTQTWATSNLEMVATPMGNVIPEVQAASNVEKVSGGDFESGLLGTLSSGDETSVYTLNTTDPISGTQDGRLVVSVAGTNAVRPLINFGTNVDNTKIIRYRFKYKVNSGTCRLRGYFTSTSSVSYFGGSYITLSGSGEFIWYISNSASTPRIYFDGLNTFDIQIDDVSLEEVGWAGLQVAYNRFITQGDTVAVATRKCAAWCYYNNDPNLGAVYGKSYNRFAAKLLATDIAAYNVANPLTPWGWDIPTRAQLTTLAAQGGNAVKMTGTNYWTTANGTNASGLSVLGSGYRTAAGAFVNLKTSAGILCKDADFVREVANGDDTFAEAPITLEGDAIRLIKV